MPFQNIFMKQTLCSLLSLVLVIFLMSSCYRGPEDLPKLKKKFQSQINQFEKQKENTDDKVEVAVEKLTSFQQAIKDAENADAEFKKVYNQWHKVNKEVKDLNKEYERLKNDADNLFNAMENQTNSLGDATTRNELNGAIAKTRGSYNTTLKNTEKAVSSLNSLHGEALEIIKALEVAVAVGEIANINTGLKNIESRVDAIMGELNITISQSKELYETRIGAF